MKQLNIFLITCLSLIATGQAFAQNPLVTQRVYFTDTNVTASDSAAANATTGIIRYDHVTGKFRFYNAVTGTWYTFASGFSLANGDKGDLTVSGPSTWTIDNSAVSFAKIADGSALSVLGRSANSVGVQASIAAGTDGHVLRRSGTTLGFGTIATAGITDAAVTYAKLQNISGLSIPGRASNTSGVMATITGTDGQALRVSGTTLGFGTIATAGIANDAVTYAKIQNVSATSRFLGRITASAGDVEELTGTQATSLLDVAGAATAGIVSTGAQVFSGPKTFNDNLLLSSAEFTHDGGTLSNEMFAVQYATASIQTGLKLANLDTDAKTMLVFGENTAKNGAGFANAYIMRDGSATASTGNDFYIVAEGTGADINITATKDIVLNAAGGEVKLTTVPTNDNTATSLIVRDLSGNVRVRNASTIFNSLNGLTGPTQTFATGTSGTDFGISSSGTTHTFNMPYASKTANGLMTIGSQEIMGVKSMNVGTALTNTLIATARFNLISSGDMVDGFGPVLDFRIEDNAAVSNRLGFIGFRRSGADDTGEFFISPATAGSASTAMTITSTGVINIPVTPTTDNTNTAILTRDGSGNVEVRDASTLGLSDGDKGDITVGSSQTTLTIDSDVITASSYNASMTCGTNCATAGQDAIDLYTRIKNRVMITGNFTVDPTATGPTSVSMSLPVGSNFSATNDASGVGVCLNTSDVAVVTADVAGDLITFTFNATATANLTFSFSVQYNIE